jgi:DNA topoisomerase-3
MSGLKPVSASQLLYAKKIAQGRGLIIPDDAEASLAAMSAWIEANRGPERGRKVPPKAAVIVAPRGKTSTKRARKRKTGNDVGASTSTPSSSGVATTPLRIPFGNKEIAVKLGARYGSAGWYAPPGVDLSAFGERGWL